MEKKNYFIHNYVFNNYNINFGKLGNNNSWFRASIIKHKISRLMLMRMDMWNVLRNDKWFTKRQFLYVFAEHYVKYLPDSVSINDIQVFNMLFTKRSNPYRYYRFFMGFPSKGQRTWSNAKSAKKRINYAKSWEEDLTTSQFEFNCPKYIIKKLCHMEFLNRTWQTQWHHEWVCARLYRKKFDAKNRYKSWYFGMEFAQQNRALTYYTHVKKKKKKGKKKITLPKNQINVGMKYGFAKDHFKRLFSINIWKKKSGSLF